MVVDNWIPASIEAVDGTWLSEALGREVSVLGAPEPLTSYACQVHRLRLDVASDVIVKLPIDGDLRPLIDSLGLYRRELTFYDQIAGPCPLRTPAAHVARVADDSSDFVLVLEDLGASHAADQLTGLSLDAARAAIDELARFHAWSWGRPRLDELAAVFPPLGSAGGRAMQEQWGQFFGTGWPFAAGVAGDVLTPEVDAFAERFADYVGFFVDELAEPRVLTHGDYRADNMVFDAGGHPVLIDFHNVQQECGLRELAYFLVQSLTTEQRRGNDEALVRRYLDRLREAGIMDYPWERAWRQYRLGAANQLMMAVVVAMRYETVDEQGKAELVEMIRRGVAAIDDLGAVELLPAL